MPKPAAKALLVSDAPELAALGFILSGKDNAINNSEMKSAFNTVARILLVSTAGEVDQFNRKNLPSMRDRNYLMGKLSSKKPGFSSNMILLVTLDKDRLALEIFLAMIKAPFVGMQGEDVLPALANALINTPLLVLEMASNIFAKVLMVPHVLCRNQYDKETNPLKKAGWAIASALTWLPGALGFPFSLAGKVCSYTRALIDSAACFLNEFTFSLIGAGIRSLAGLPKQDNVSLELCVKSFFVNLSRLAVIGGAIAACVLIPGSVLAAPIVNAVPTVASIVSVYLTTCAISFIASASSGFTQLTAWWAEKSILASESKAVEMKPLEHGPIKAANTRQINAAIEKTATLKPPEAKSEKLDESPGISLRRPSQNSTPSVSPSESRASDDSEVHLLSSKQEIPVMTQEQAMDFLFNSKLENKFTVMEAIRFAKSDDMEKEAKMDAVPGYIEALQNARQQEGISEPMNRYLADTIEKINDFQPSVDNANRPSMP